MATAAKIAEAASRLATAARSAGVPRDSLERFLRAGYVPQPKQLLFHAAARECDRPDGPTEVGFGGARGPGKSHAGLAQIALDDCQRAPGLKFLFLRKVGKAARESFEDLRVKVLPAVPHDYKSQAGVLELTKTGSRIILGHFNSESDLDNYLGIEYDGVLVEESNQISAAKHRQIKTSVRTSKQGWRPRIYHTFNPGGVGHEHTKQKFITPWRKGEERETRFVFATYRDNRFLNPEYEQSLNELKGWLRAAWRDGDWDIAAGQFFTNWRHDAVVVKPFTVPKSWKALAWGGLDYGFTHPTVCYPVVTYDGTLYVLGEYWAQKRLPARNADGIKALGARLGLGQWWLRKVYAGHDCFEQKGDATGLTIADQYREQGILLLRANNARVSGAGEILNLLGDPDARPRVPPRIRIFSTCTRLVECLPAMQHDPHNPEDVLKVDVDEDGQGGDDPYDCLRYAAMANKAGAPAGSVAGHRQTSGLKII
jgi:phage terminase large subunit